MDNLTHTLFGLTLARTPLGRSGRGITTALVLASNAPDIDVVMTARGNVSYLEWHRGPTHGVIGVVALGLLVAFLVRLGQRIVDRRGRPPGEEAEAPLGMLIAVSIIAVVCHILMDFPTSYGTRLLSPFDWHWFAIDLMPIVDVYLIVIMIAGLVFGASSPEARRRNAAIVLVLMAANYSVRAVARYQAIGLAPRVFGPTWPQRCDGGAHDDRALVSVWPRDVPRTPASGTRCLVEVAAMPSFFSPFRWRLIAQMSNAYEMADVDVLDSRLRRPAGAEEAPQRLLVRFPNVWTDAVKTAATARIPRIFLGFSRFPAARSLTDRTTGETTVRWTDMRFATGLTIDQRAGANLFTVTARLDPNGRIIDQTLGPPPR
ncbi:MAG TPA: metal-dependent hydrolase [Vicinamibacterales bacterium]|nr:metal-dependent hydrolase [Vicinamibacterales bacterium]